MKQSVKLLAGGLLALPGPPGLMVQTGLQAKREIQARAFLRAERPGRYLQRGPTLTMTRNGSTNPEAVPLRLVCPASKAEQER